MPIIFDQLPRLCPRLSRLKHGRVLSGSSYDKIRAAITTPISSGLDIGAIDAICRYLDCQPADIMRYVKEAAPAADATTPDA